MPTVTLLTGGARSGKSTFALQLAAPHTPKFFVATAEPFDDEMRDRVVKHQAERGPEFSTIEEPLHLAQALRSIREPGGVAVVDCLTVWLGNLMHHLGDGPALEREFDDLCACLADAPCNVILVTNEVGNGIVPAEKLSRCYRDLAGRLNQRVAAVATEVYLVVCGIPMKIK